MGQLVQTVTLVIYKVGQFVQAVIVLTLWKYRTIDIDNGRRSEQWWLTCENIQEHEHSRWIVFCFFVVLFCLCFVYMFYFYRFYCVYLNFNCGNVQSGEGVVRGSLI